jgi:hypothetical protein
MVHSDEAASVPFPAVLSIAIQLVESRSVAEFNQFDLAPYRVGDLENAFTAFPSINSTLSQGQEAQISPALPTLPSVPDLPPLPTLPPLGAALSEAKKSDRPFLGRVSQMFKAKKGWNGPEPGHKDTFTGF